MLLVHCPQGWTPAALSSSPAPVAPCDALYWKFSYSSDQTFWILSISTWKIHPFGGNCLGLSLRSFPRSGHQFQLHHPARKYLQYIRALKKKTFLSAADVFNSNQIEDFKVMIMTHRFFWSWSYLSTKKCQWECFPPEYQCQVKFQEVSSFVMQEENGLFFLLEGGSFCVGLHPKTSQKNLPPGARSP